jgi:hypothetical protein
VGLSGNSYIIQPVIVQYLLSIELILFTFGPLHSHRVFIIEIAFTTFTLIMRSMSTCGVLICQG